MADQSLPDQSFRGWLARNRGGLAVGVLGMILVGLAATFLQRPTATPLVVQPPKGGADGALAASVRASPSPQVIAPIAVHLSGEVARPGLYQLPPGARIDDGVQAAGGPTLEADLNRLNLAARLADGQQVVVPRRAEVASAGVSAGPVGGAPTRLNVNLAGVAELDGLPGVGPVTAQRIVAYRQQHGPFARIEQLVEAKLVSAAMFEKMRELVTV